MPETAGIDYYDTSVFFVLFVTFVVIPGFSQKLRERDNQRQGGQIGIKYIHDDLTADTEN